MYTEMHLTDKERDLVSRGLKSFLRELDGYNSDSTSYLKDQTKRLLQRFQTSENTYLTKSGGDRRKYGDIR